MLIFIQNRKKILMPRVKKIYSTVGKVFTPCLIDLFEILFTFK